MDDGVSAWLARTRLALGGRRGTSAASLIVEAFGDAVVPQIPEAIGRAILRSEAALNAVLGGVSADDPAAAVDPADNAPAEDPTDHGGAS